MEELKEEIKAMLESCTMDDGLEKCIVEYINSVIKNGDHTNFKGVQIINTLLKHHLMMAIQVLPTSNISIQDVQEILIENYVTISSMIIKHFKKNGLLK